MKIGGGAGLKAWSAAACVLFTAFLIPARAYAQAPNPHDAQPERPTVGTHTATVAPGWIEIETGFQRQSTGALSNSLAVPFVAKIGLSQRLQLNVAPGWQRDADGGEIENGITDLLLALKWRFGEDVPFVGDLALQTAVSLPSGSEEAGRGTGSAGLNVVVISSQQLGRFAVDVNLAYRRQGGDGYSCSGEQDALECLDRLSNCRAFLVVRRGVWVSWHERSSRYASDRGVPHRPDLRSPSTTRARRRSDLRHHGVRPHRRVWRTHLERRPNMAAVSRHLSAIRDSV